jgi:gamma-glutamyltranspeptidase
MVEALRHAFAIRMSLSDPGFYANKTMSAVHDLVSGSYMEVLRKSTRDNDTLPLSMYGGKWAQLHDTDGEKAVQDAHEGDRRLRRPTTTRRLARPFGYLEDSGTSSLSVVDKEGNAVAITSSVNQILGSYVFSESTGVLLGNTMDGESKIHRTETIVA